MSIDEAVGHMLILDDKHKEEEQRNREKEEEWSRQLEIQGQ